MRHGTGAFLCLVVVAVWAGAAWADDYVGATGGNYNVGANWSGGTVPDSDDSAYIRNGATVTLDASVSGVVELMLGHPSDPSAVGGSALHILPGASLTATQTVRAGGSYSATAVQSGGLITASGFNVASGGGASGQYTLTGGTLTTHYSTAPGGTGSTMAFGAGGGTGKFLQTGGYVQLINSTYIHVGNGVGSYGEFTMTNGSIYVNYDQFNVGAASGRGTFNMSGGVVETNYKFQIGYRGNGVVNQSGGTVRHNPANVTPENLTIGQCDTSTTVPSLGIYNLSGGLLNVNRRIYMGSKFDNVTTFTPGRGQLNVSGGSVVNLVEYTSVGYKGGQGTLTVSGTGYAQFRKLNVADSFENAIPAGWVKVSGGMLSTGDGGFTLGRSGPAYMDVTGGSVLAGYTSTTVSLRAGDSDPNAEAILNISGGVVTAPYQVDLGYQEGRGTLNLSGTGRLEVGGDTIINREALLGNSGGRGAFNMTGGSFQGNMVYVGYRGSVSPGLDAKLSITGGTFRAAQVRMLTESAAGVGNKASLTVGANADVALVDWFMIQQSGASVEMQIASATKNSKIVTTGSVDLGTSLGTLDVNTTGYRPKEGDEFTLLTALYTMTGNFSSIGSNITLGLPGGSAFSGAIVTDPNTAAKSYVATFLGYTAGDANGDQIVDGGDLALLGGAWTQSGKSWGNGDFTGEGLVDGGDLALIGGNWNWSLPPAPGAPLPEPATLALLSLGALAVIRRKSR